MTVQLNDKGQLRSVVISKIEPIAAGVMSIWLRDPCGLALPRWTPGAHIQLQLGDGLVRSYSLCGNPDDRFSWRIAVLLVPDSSGGSRYLHNTARVGQILPVRGPRNLFELVEAERYLFVAGGIGITPIIPMMEHLLKQGKEWRLLYGGRSRASMAFAGELGRLGDRVHIVPQDERGLPDLKDFLGEPSPGTVVYCCGPRGLLEAVEGLSSSWSNRLHLERFQPVSLAGGDTNEEFDVTLRRAGVTIRVRRDQSIIEAMEEAGLRVTASCREGTCGTCETTIIGGIPDHRCSFLNSDERASGETMMICCSRSKGTALTLDL